MKTLVALVILPLLLAAGCATDTGDVAKDRRGRVTNAVAEEVFDSVVSFGLSEGKSYLAGQNGQDAAAGAFQAASSGLLSSSSFEHIVSAYAGPQVGQLAGEEFAKANPQTAAQSQLTANIIGAGLQLAANALAK